MPILAIPHADARVQAICDCLHERITFNCQATDTL